MDPSERLRMLFHGEDEALLSMNVGLQEQQQQQNSPPIATHSRLAAMPPSAQGLNQPIAATTSCEPDDSDEEVFADEYLASFSQASKNAAKQSISSKNKKNQNRGKMLGRQYEPGVDLARPVPPSNQTDDDMRYFCSVMPVSRFPYKYIHGSDADRIAKAFFDGGKFWGRTWDLYYIHPPTYLSAKPILLVPEFQAQDLIDNINNAFGCKLSIPSGEGLGILLPFVEDGTPQPQYLGKSRSREMKEALERGIPSSSGDNHEPPEGCSPELNRSFAAFKVKMEAAVDATRRKSKAAKGKRQQSQVQKARSWCRGLKRTQCFLGLRPRLPRDGQHNNDEVSWEAQQQADKERALANGTVLMPLDLDEPAPFLFVDEPIFISVDVEANEKQHDQVTEIGISTLDTLDLTATPPGDGGCNWMAKIRSRHFRVSEYSSVTNTDFVAGCPDKFEFGESEWVSTHDAAKVVESCFQPPYSAQVAYTARPRVEPKPNSKKTKEVEYDANDTELDGGVKLPTQGANYALNETKASHSDLPTNHSGYYANESRSNNPIKAYKKMQRNIILLGHDISSDMNYLRKLGCTILDSPKGNSTTNKNLPHFLENIDTSNLFRVLKRDMQASSLAKLLVDLGLTGWHLHNAGNDARYTMEAMIGIAIKSRLQGDDLANKTKSEAAAPTANNKSLPRGEIHIDCSGKAASDKTGKENKDPAWQAEIERRVATKVEEVETRVREECAIWDFAMGWKGDWDVPNDDVDGGIPSGLKGE